MKNKLKLIAVLLAFLFVLSGCGTKTNSGKTEQETNGNGIQVSLCGTKYFEVSGISKMPQTEWRQILPPPFTNDGSGMNPPTVAEGKVFVGGTEGYFAFSLHTGKEIWENKNPQTGLSVNSLKYFNGKLYTVSYSAGQGTTPDIHLVCLDAKTGKMLWKSPVLGKMPNDVSNNIVFLDGKLYIGGYTNKGAGIYCIDPSNGKTVYTFPVKNLNPFFDSLISDGKYIYGFTMTNKDSVTSGISVFCFNPEPRKMQWEFPAGDDSMYNFRWMRLGIADSAFIIQYLAVPKDNITPNELTVIEAFDAKTHKKLWEKKTCCIDKNDKSAFRMKNYSGFRFQYFQIPDFSANEKFVFTTLGDGKLIAINIRTGKTEWYYEEKEGLPDDKDRSIQWFGTMRSWCVKNVLYAAINLPDKNKSKFVSYVFAFDPGNGKVLWKKEIPGTDNADVRMMPVGGGIVLRYGNTDGVYLNETLEFWKQ